jgi:hypothetical protein
MRSPRIDAIILIINEHRKPDGRGGDAIVISDESIIFLDILAIALRNMEDPIPCFPFDGRDNQAARDKSRIKFRDTVGCRVLPRSKVVALSMSSSTAGPPM